MPSLLFPYHPSLPGLAPLTHLPQRPLLQPPSSLDSLDPAICHSSSIPVSLLPPLLPNLLLWESLPSHDPHAPSSSPASPMQLHLLSVLSMHPSPRLPPQALLHLLLHLFYFNPPCCPPPHLLLPVAMLASSRSSRSSSRTNSNYTSPLFSPTPLLKFVQWNVVPLPLLMFPLSSFNPLHPPPGRRQCRRILRSGWKPWMLNTPYWSNWVPGHPPPFPLASAPSTPSGPSSGSSLMAATTCTRHALLPRVSSSSPMLNMVIRTHLSAAWLLFVAFLAVVAAHRLVLWKCHVNSLFTTSNSPLFAGSRPCRTAFSPSGSTTASWSPPSSTRTFYAPLLPVSPLSVAGWWCTLTTYS